MQREKPATGEMYHVYNRGVEKRSVFANDQDRQRFINSLIVFNDNRPPANSARKLDPRSKWDFDQLSDRQKMVEIIAFVLMPNHYHLLLRQETDNGITEFMRKVGTGYTNYFNKKYQRVGALFQGIYKTAQVNKEHHLQYLPHYIHLNPLDSGHPEWREGAILNPEQALAILDDYPWSSYHQYTNRSKWDFDRLVDLGVVDEVGIDRKNYRQDLLEWLSEDNLDEISGIVID